MFCAIVAPYSAAYSLLSAATMPLCPPMRAAATGGGDQGVGGFHIGGEATLPDVLKRGPKTPVPAAALSTTTGSNEAPEPLTALRSTRRTSK